MDTQVTIAVILSVLFIATAQIGQNNEDQSELDGKVEKFLNKHKNDWNALNVPFADGKILHDLILKNNYKSALEIGTSTGHSTIWMAWALSKTGGKIITIELDAGRHKEALRNFEEAGVAKYIDARLANAHDLVKALPGPFDFVFSDADKEWYTQYFKDVEPKITMGGTFTAHNVTDGFAGVEEFVKYIKTLSNYDTRIDKTSSSGISVSRKKSNGKMQK